MLPKKSDGGKARESSQEGPFRRVRHGRALDDVAERYKNDALHSAFENIVKVLKSRTV